MSLVLNTHEKRQTFAALAEACMSDALNESDFSRIVQQFVRVLLPHVSLVAAVGRLSFDHVLIDYLAGVDFPAGNLAQIPRQLNIAERPLLAAWLHCRDAIVIDSRLEPQRLSAREHQEIAAFGLGRIAIHGVLDLAGKQASYFSFSQVVGSDAELVGTLRLVVPLLHRALIKLAGKLATRPDRLAVLRSEELEILRLIAYGRSNAEIAAVICRSEKTVRNRLTRIFDALEVTSRTEALSLYLREA